MVEPITTFYAGENDNDSLVGEAGDDNLQGNENNDILNGGIGNDNLYGGFGTDTLIGGDGNDWIRGADGGANDINTNQFDRLTGGAGADNFVLGDALFVNSWPHYLGVGNAIITDFNTAEDRIRLYGNRDSYSLNASGLNNTGIYYQGDLVAVVQNATNLDLSQPYFVFFQF
jgi:Ca2+-binding RTX toxin-like protein